MVEPPSGAVMALTTEQRAEIMADTSAPHLSPANVAHYLRGIGFPATKRDIRAEAQKNHAPPEVLKLIDELPAERYHTMPEVMKAVGQVERS